MRLLWTGAVSPGALTLGTAWLSPPDRQAPTQCRRQQDSYRQMATVIGCNPDTAVLIFWLKHNPPLPPLLSPCRHHAHTQTYTILPSQGGGAGAEAETRVIYSHSAAQLWPATLQLEAIVQGFSARLLSRTKSHCYALEHRETRIKPRTDVSFTLS